MIGLLQLLLLASMFGQLALVLYFPLYELVDLQRWSFIEDGVVVCLSSLWGCAQPIGDGASSVSLYYYLPIFFRIFLVSCIAHS